MNREVHVRNCEGVGVKLPRATRLWLGMASRPIPAMPPGLRVRKRQSSKVEQSRKPPDAAGYWRPGAVQDAPVATLPALGALPRPGDAPFRVAGTDSLSPDSSLTQA